MPKPCWRPSRYWIAFATPGGPQAEYVVPLPEAGEPKRAILDSYTKEHSAEYQAQALIDLARRIAGVEVDLERHPIVVVERAVDHQNPASKLEQAVGGIADRGHHFGATKPAAMARLWYSVFFWSSL